MARNFIFAGAVCKTRGFTYGIHLPCVKHGVSHTGFICRVQKWPFHIRSQFLVRKSGGFAHVTIVLASVVSIDHLITPNYRMNQRQITEKFNAKLPKIEIIN